MECIIFYGDTSDYSASLLEELEATCETVVAVDSSRDVEQALRGPLSAVVLVNPHLHRIRALRGALNDAGITAKRVPLIAALGHEEMMGQAELLEMADDFVVKPAGAAEILCRMGFRRRRRGSDNTIHFDELSIDLDAHQVFLQGEPLDLTFKEYELLKMLSQSPGRAFSREQLLNSVWGYDYMGGTRTVDVHVRRLRAKTEHNRRFIETVHGVGYRFVSAE